GKVEFNKIENIKNILLLIGPEGGFTNSEIIIANKLGFQSINLGKRVLRTETASLAMLSAMHMLFGDFV
ncbi:MAG: RsmE family RNA methyltransferase, partial [Methylophilaceae bacterium]